MDLPGYTANATALWNDLCVQQVFISLINTWGGPFFLEYPDSGANLSYWAAGNLTPGFYEIGFWYATFNVNWVAAGNNSTPAQGCCIYEEHWAGNVMTNVLSGPYLCSYPIVYASPRASTSLPCEEVGPPTSGSSPSPGFPYGPVLGFSLAGTFVVGVAFLARRRN